MVAGASLLEMRHITKEFPGVKALSDVNLEVQKAEIHALCGENGAGKSTLMKVLSGNHPSGTYQGEILINAIPQKFSSIRDSEKAGVAIIYQELSVVDEMTVGENIFMGSEPNQFGIVDWNSLYSMTSGLLKMVGLDVNPREKLKNLGIGQKQLIEIAKALSKNADILVLDEPTSALSDKEVEGLLDLLRSLREQNVSCIIITHRLNEVFAIADRITVLRDGQTIATHDVDEITEDQIVAEMVGRELTDLYPYRERDSGQTILEVRDLTIYHPSLPGRKVIEKVSFSVKQGELLGISGLMGAGRTELLMSLFGVYPGQMQGQIWLDGKPFTPSSPQKAISAGLSLVSEDRKRFGLVLEETVMQNISLAALPHMSKFGFVENSREASAAQEYAEYLHIKMSSVDVPVRHLSGGNQQKVVIAKCLLTNPKVLFLDEPTRGIDVGAKSEIYNILLDLAEKGMAIIVVSSELPEILGICDRILVLSQGRLTGSFNHSEATQEKIMSRATMVNG